MKHVHIEEVTADDIKITAWSTDSGSIIISLKYNDFGIDLTEDDLAKIRKLVDEAKYVIGG